MHNQKKIIIVGGSGFIGTKLCEQLLAQDYLVTVVDLVQSRLTHPMLSFVKCNLAIEDISPSVLDGAYGVINLAGATIGKRWNAEYKKLIYTSRIDTTRNLVAALGKLTHKPTVLVNASAVGYYGDQQSTELKESAPAGKDFLAQVCVDWEREALIAQNHNIRVVIIRTAHVFGPGGLLTSLMPIFKYGLGGYFGGGKQYMPWIHWKDIVGLYTYALEKPLVGAHNVGAGKTPTQKELFRAFAKSIRMPIVWNIPAFMAKIVLGEFGTELLASQNTISQKVLDTGYVYQFSDMHIALADIYPRK